MYRMFKVYVLVLVSIASLFSFGMNRVNRLPIQPRDNFRMTSEASRGQGMNRALATERAPRHFDRLAEDSNKTKLLEHSCFKGESSNCQGRFFSSNYMDLPNDVAFPIALITNGVPVDRRGFVFAYHAHYRKKCEYLIDAFERAAIEKAMLYDRQAQKLIDRPDAMEQFISLDRMAMEDLRQRGIVAGRMIGALSNNHYPLVLAIHQEYCDMPK